MNFSATPAANGPSPLTGYGPTGAPQGPQPGQGLATDAYVPATAPQGTPVDPQLQADLASLPGSPDLDQFVAAWNQGGFKPPLPVAGGDGQVDVLTRAAIANAMAGEVPGFPYGNAFAAPPAPAVAAGSPQPAYQVMGGGPGMVTYTSGEAQPPSGLASADPSGAPMGGTPPAIVMPGTAAPAYPPAYGTAAPPPYGTPTAGGPVTAQPSPAAGPPLVSSTEQNWGGTPSGAADPNGQSSNQTLSGVLGTGQPTGQPATPPVTDPMTGQPVNPNSVPIDPMTGQPINPNAYASATSGPPSNGAFPHVIAAGGRLIWDWKHATSRQVRNVLAAAGLGKLAEGKDGQKLVSELLRDPKLLGKLATPAKDGAEATDLAKALAKNPHAAELLPALRKEPKVLAALAKQPELAEQLGDQGTKNLSKLLARNPKLVGELNSGLIGNLDRISPERADQLARALASKGMKDPEALLRFASGGDLSKLSDQEFKGVIEKAAAGTLAKAAGKAAVIGAGDAAKLLHLKPADLAKLEKDGYSADDLAKLAAGLKPQDAEKVGQALLKGTIKPGDIKDMMEIGKITPSFSRSLLVRMATEHDGKLIEAMRVALKGVARATGPMMEKMTQKLGPKATQVTAAALDRAGARTFAGAFAKLVPGLNIGFAAWGTKQVWDGLHDPTLSWHTKLSLVGANLLDWGIAAVSLADFIPGVDLASIPATMAMDGADLGLWLAASVQEEMDHGKAAAAQQAQVGGGGQGVNPQPAMPMQTGDVNPSQVGPSAFGQ